MTNQLMVSTPHDILLVISYVPQNTFQQARAKVEQQQQWHRTVKASSVK